jgi:hypothetical protein
MIEFMTSKVVGAVAALILLGSVLGFFEIQRSFLEERHFRDMNDSVVRLIDGVSAAGGETSANITFAEGMPGLGLDFYFRGKGYDIEVRTGQVIFRQGGLVVAEGLTRAVHPWNPAILGSGATLYSSAEELGKLDRDHPVLTVASGRGFMAESRLVVLSGEPAFLSFVHF